MTTLLLATRSADKVREITDILAQSWRGRILSLEDAGIDESPDEEGIECFDSFLDNARAKAAWFMNIAGLPTIADDSGISVDALGGAPGTRSKRFAAQPGLHGIDLDRANNDHLLEKLLGVQDTARTAHYTCAAVLLTPAGVNCEVVGTRSGRILDNPRGPHGFGYDPLFLDAGTGLSFGEMQPSLKNRTSHRSRAFRALATHLPL